MRSSLLVALALAVAACSRDAPRKPRESSFSVVLFGGVNVRFAGRAIACTDTDMGDSATFVRLEQGAQHVLVTLPSAAPAADATYPVAPRQAQLIYGTDWHGGPDTFISDTGTLRITAATATRIAGTARYLARDVSGERKAAGEVTFDAVRVGRAVNGSCVANGGAATGAAQPPDSAPAPAPGTFYAEIEREGAKVRAAGVAGFCLGKMEGRETYSVQMLDTISGGRAWLAHLPPDTVNAPVSRMGAWVWLEPAGDTARHPLNGGYVVVTRFDSTGIGGRIRAVHDGEPRDPSSWAFSANFYAQYAGCDRGR